MSSNRAFQASLRLCVPRVTRLDDHLDLTRERLERWSGGGARIQGQPERQARSGQRRTTTTRHNSRLFSGSMPLTMVLGTRASAQGSSR